jgi:HTH-type transcriptional regulator/antitoxin HigA
MASKEAATPARAKVTRRPKAPAVPPHTGGRRASAAYLALVSAYPIHPIRSDDDLDEAIAKLDELMSRPEPLEPQEQDYFDSLSHEIQRYEAETIIIPRVSGITMLRYLIEQRGVSLSRVAKATGIVVSTLSAILAGKRKLNLDHIRALAPYFGVEAEVFLD